MTTKDLKNFFYPAIVSLLLFVISFSLRSYGNQINHPFWVDEFSSANQARLISKHQWQLFNQTADYVEHHNLTTHLLVATSFKLFGESTSSARFPFIVIGSIVPIAVFFLLRDRLNNSIAFSSSLLISTSYFQIVWSNQARSYILQQLLAVLAMIFYFNINKNIRDYKSWGWLGLLLILGILTHKLFFFLVITFGVHFVLKHHSHVHKNIKPLLWLGVALIITLLLLLVFTNYFNTVWLTIQVGFISFHNNFWYYHAFFWRNYSLVSFMAFLGLFFLYQRDKDLFFISSTWIGLHLIFITFLFEHYISKYTLPIFFLLLALTAVTLYELSLLMINRLPKYKILKTHQASMITLLLTLIIIGNGDKFVYKPKVYYTPNHDMREIPIVDYDQIYQYIKSKINQSNSQVAVIDTWSDRPLWYFDNTQHIYIFRWMKGNAHQYTRYYEDDLGRKYLPESGDPPLKFIGELADLQKAMKVYEKGFIWIDDTSLPGDVVSYVQENFQKELFLDHYPLDENPYSLWPGTLYSWGFDN